ncbi:MAG: zinc-ribbon domain-containing protein [Myxococcales bacterium]|nr:zinc-ribbon domain-containing protein [Myxococcales bacterium]
MGLAQILCRTWAYACEAGNRRPILTASGRPTDPASRDDSEFPLMRIVCDNCSAKYQISDDKVRNKVFKIRCKRCAHVIVVRAKQDGEAPAEAQDDATKVVKFPAGDAPAATAPPADAIWYLVVNRESVGPLSDEQVEGYYTRGEVDGEAFTWSEGMTDWTRLASVPEFAHLFPAAAPEAEPTVGDTEAAGAFAALDAARRANVPDDDDGIMASNNVADPDGGLVVAAPAHVEPAESPRVGSNLRNQRNENSVLFSLDSLAAEERAPAVTNTGGSEGSGLIDISAILGGGGPAPAAAMDDPFGGGGGFVPVSASPVGGAPMPSLVTKPGPSTAKVAGITALVVLLLGGGAAAWWFTTQQKDPAPAPVATNDGTPAVATVKMGAGAAAPATQPASVVNSAAPATAAAPATEAVAESAPPAAPTSLADAAAAQEASKPAAKPSRPAPTKRKATRRDTPKPLAQRSPDPEDDPPARPAPRPQPKPRRQAKPAAGGGGDELDSLLGSLDKKGTSPARQAPAGASPRPAAGGGGAADPMLPERLSKQQILMVVRKNASSIRQCRQADPNATGTVMVSMLIGRSGQVQRADVESGQFKGTPVGNCVEGKVRSFRFPQFSGEPLRVNMPFAI